MEKISERQEPAIQIEDDDWTLSTPSSTTPSFFNPFENLKIPSDSRVKQVWAVGGGKGGVGKSMLASTLAYSLSKTGNKVVGIDLDLGAANLHTLLGLDLPKLTLSDFFRGRKAHLNDCLVKTSQPNLEIISGAQDSIDVANLEDEKKRMLLQQLRELDADYVILDLGAGTTFHTLDFFVFADVGMITLLPEPTSIENGYRFIKSVYYRRLLLSPNLTDIRPIIRQVIEGHIHSTLKTPSDLFKAVSRMNPEAAMRLKEEIERFNPKLIVNQARTQSDIDIGFSIKSVCKKYFGVEMDYLGYLDHDSTVWQAIRKKRPVAVEFPHSRLVGNVDRMVQYLLKHHRQSKNFLANI